MNPPNDPLRHTFFLRIPGELSIPSVLACSRNVSRMTATAMFLFVGTGIVFGWGREATEPESSEFSRDASGGAIQLQPSHFNFGILPTGTDPVKISTRLASTLNEPVKLGRIRTSCACSKPVVSATTLTKSKPVVLTTSVNASQRAGPFEGYNGPGILDR